MYANNSTSYQGLKNLMKTNLPGYTKTADIYKM